MVDDETKLYVVNKIVRNIRDLDEADMAESYKAAADLALRLAKEHKDNAAEIAFTYALYLKNNAVKGAYMKQKREEISRD